MKGVTSTSGHLADNGGIRGHSAGSVFPYVVYARGPEQDRSWHITGPETINEYKCLLDSEYPTFIAAEAAAAILKMARIGL